MRIKLTSTVDLHDYEQLQLLARLHKLRISEVVAKIVKAYLDKRTADAMGEKS